MKKSFKGLIYILSLTLAVALAGCSTKSSNTTNTTNSNTAVQSTTGTVDPEQPARVVEIYGKVKSVQGNVVAIAKMTQAQNGQTLTEEEKKARQAERQNMSEEERKKAKEAAETLTGESVTVEIPVGVPIRLKASQTQGGAITDGALTDVKQGVILSIWTEGSTNSGKATAEYVRISGVN